ASCSDPTISTVVGVCLSSSSHASSGNFCSTAFMVWLSAILIGGLTILFWNAEHVDQRQLEHLPFSPGGNGRDQGSPQPFLRLLIRHEVIADRLGRYTLLPVGLVEQLQVAARFRLGQDLLEPR